MSLGRYSRKECGGNPGYPASVSNGKVPTALMRRLKSQSHLGTGPGRYLVPAGAEGFDAMVVAAKRDGISLRLLGGYRTYAKQVQLRKQWADRGKPEYAAKPGTSNHGWATACDIDRHSAGTSGIVTWMQKNARHYGWDHPTWAGDGRSPEEPWHWEYIRGFKMSETEQPEFTFLIDGKDMTQEAGAVLEGGTTKIKCEVKTLTTGMGWRLVYDSKCNQTRVETG